MLNDNNNNNSSNNTITSSSIIANTNTKTCYKCGDTKPEKLFVKNYKKNSKSYGKPSTLCKKCKNKTNNKSPSQKRAKLNKKIKNQKFLFDFLKDKSCVDCGETNILVLQFDHLDGTEKLKGICEMIIRSISQETIKKEIEKCEIVCANCHTIRTMKRGNHWRYKMAKENNLI